jgi:hypothetical protein
LPYFLFLILAGKYLLWKYIISLLITPGLLVYLIPVGKSPYFIAAIILISVAILMILWQAYQIRFQPFRDEQLLTNRQFLGQYIENVNRKIRLTDKYMWIYAGLIIFAVNLGYLEALKHLSLSARLIIHTGFTFGLFYVFSQLIKKRLQKYRIEMDPLLEILEDLKKNST